MKNAPMDRAKLSRPARTLIALMALGFLLFALPATQAFAASPTYQLPASLAPVVVGNQLTLPIILKNGDGTTSYPIDVDWGDGTPHTFTSGIPPVSGVVQVKPVHIYVSPGYYTVTVLMPGVTVISGGPSRTVTVSPPTLTVAPIAPILIGTLLVPVITITGDPAVAYAVSVIWGDGSPQEDYNYQPGTYSPTHLYLFTGTYTMHVAMPAIATDLAQPVQVKTPDPQPPALTVNGAPYLAPCGNMNTDQAPNPPLCFLQLGLGYYTLTGSILDDDSSSWTVDVTWDDGGASSQWTILRQAAGPVPFAIAHLYTDYPHPNDINLRAIPKVQATDETGKHVSQDFPLPGILIKDTTPPEVLVPGQGPRPPVPAVEASQPTGGLISFGAGASDNDPNLTFICNVDGNPGLIVTSGVTVLDIGTTVIDCVATDSAGNTGSGQFSVTVRDTTPPAFLPFPSDQTFEAFDDRGVAVTYSVGALDNYTANPQFSCYPISGAVFPFGQTTVTCNAFDQAGNQATRSFKINVVDTHPPVLALPSAVNIEATGPDGAVATFLVSATDIRPLQPAVNCTGPNGQPVVSGDVFPVGQTLVNCASIDESNNVGTGSFIVTVTDLTPPVLHLPANISVPATGPGGAVVNYSVTADDLVSLTHNTIDCQPASGSTFPTGAPTTVNCSATDERGNTSFSSFTITVTDQSPPVLTVPPDMTVTAPNGSNTATVTFSPAPSAVDDVDPNPVVTCTPPTGNSFPIGTTTVTCTASDSAGNTTAPKTFNVIVKDGTPPVLALPANISVTATSGAGAAVTYIVTATDNIDAPPAIVITCNPLSGSIFAAGSTTTVTCTARDTAGNVSPAGTFTVTVAAFDTTPPVLTVPPDITVTAPSGSNTANVTFTPAPSATDDTDPNPVVTCSAVSGTAFPIGTTVVTCTAKDMNGNTSAPKSFNVIVKDGTPPVLALPAPITVTATAGSSSAVVNYTVTATDNVDAPPAITIVCTPASGSTFPLGMTTVTCTGTDTAGNTSAPSTFTVTVKDGTPPVLTVPPDITVTAPNGSNTANVTFTPAPTATDDTDPNPVVTCSALSGSAFPIGTTVVSCTAKDAAGNTDGPKTFKVIVKDGTPPVLTLPAPITVTAAAGATSATVTYIVTATDNVDAPPAIVITCTPASGSSFPVGTTIVTCTGTDTAGNTSAPATFTVTVKAAPTDTTPPVLVLPANITVHTAVSTGKIVTFTVTATDTAPANPVVTCTPASGSNFPVGVTTVSCSATDAAGNKSTGTFTVTVILDDTQTCDDDDERHRLLADGSRGGERDSDECCDDDDDQHHLVADGGYHSGGDDDCDNHNGTDKTAPVLTVPANITTQATSSSGKVVTYSVTATDNSGKTPTVTCSPASGSTFRIGTTTVTCTATDGSGNKTTKTFTVTVTPPPAPADTTPPVLKLPANNITVYTNSSTGAAVTFTATATDANPATPAVTCTPASGSNFPIGTTTVTCSATDAAGNKATGTFTVTVKLTNGDICKKDGWKLFSGSLFKNYGDCVSYFATKTKNPPAYIDGDRDDNSNNKK